MCKLKSSLFIFLLLCLLPTLASANITQLVMPGPLIEGHAKIEADCIRCHDLLSNELQRNLCLDCHKTVAADINTEQGFHGKNPAVRQAQCRDCHTDHVGRNTDIMLLDQDTFDHQNTDFELKGAHQNVTCSKCHNRELIKAEVLRDPQFNSAERRKHRNAPDQCYDCHKQVAPHQGRLGKKCQDCHQPEQWSKVRFSHDKTKFKLEGAHQQVSCRLCHLNQQWKKIPRDCFACHRLKDNHVGRYGKKCENCHTPTGAQKNLQGEKQSPWKSISFDHNKTKFPLRDKHREVQCTLCHTGLFGKQKLSLECASCHQTEAPHRGRYGEKCQDCHQTTGWKKTKFDHSKTKFPLRDKHSKVACIKCHTGPSDGAQLSLDCYGCHQLDDAHRGQQGKDCSGCHNQRGWREKVQFEHDLTRFPLIGMHAVAPCEACHVETAFKTVSKNCVDCHKRDDEHKQSMGSNCSTCHNPNGWDLWQFDHKTQSKFPLDGKHEDLACVACHNDPIKDKIRLTKTCANCHRKDDPHRGKFGRNCGRCHSTKSFAEIRISQ